MTVWKTDKTGSDVNPKTKYWFWLISTRWAWTFAHLVHLTQKDRFNINVASLIVEQRVQRRKMLNKMTECILNALALALALAFLF